MDAEEKSMCSSKEQRKKSFSFSVIIPSVCHSLIGSNAFRFQKGQSFGVGVCNKQSIVDSETVIRCSGIVLCQIMHPNKLSFTIQRLSLNL